MATISGFTLMSRRLGFVRDALIAGYLGKSNASEAWVTAFRSPNIFRRIFGEGAFNAAFAPIFAGELEAKGKEEAEIFANRAFTILALILVVSNWIGSQNDGSNTYIYYSDRIYQLPPGVFGIALGIVLLPDITRKLRGGREAAAWHTLNRGMELALLITLPAMVAMLVLPKEIISFSPHYKHVGLATATAVSAWVSVVLLAYGLRRRCVLTSNCDGVCGVLSWPVSGWALRFGSPGDTFLAGSHPDSGSRRRPSVS